MDVNPLWVSGAIGAVIGVLGAFIGNLCLQIRKERKEKISIRTMLKIEINNNLDILEDVFNCIQNLKPIGAQDATAWYKGYQLSLLDEMVFNKSLWDSKSVLYAVALNEYEIKQIENFYILLDKLKYYHKRMQTITETHNNSQVQFNQRWEEYFSLSKKWEIFEKNAETAIEESRIIINKLS